MSSDEHFSLRLSDSDADNQAHQKLVPNPVFGGKRTVKRFNRNPAQVRIKKSIKNCANELVRNPVHNRKKFVKGWISSRNCRQFLSTPISKQQKAAVETTNTIRTSSELRILEIAEVHNKKNANNQSASPAKRELQLNVSPQCLSKNDDAQCTQESPQNQLSSEIVESEEAEGVRLEAVNLPTVTNKDYLADNVCKNISEISSVDSRKSPQLNSNSNSSEELWENAISDCTKTSDSSIEFLGFNSSLQPVFEKVADNKRQVLKNTTTVCTEKHVSTNRKYVSSNFESTEKEGKNLPLSSSTDSSTEYLGFQSTYLERISKGNGPTNNNNYPSSYCEFVKRQNKNVPLSCSSVSSTEFSGFVKFTSTPNNRILRRRRYCEPSPTPRKPSESSSRSKNKSSSTDESYSSPVNTAKHNFEDTKRRKFIRTSSSSDSADIVNIPRNTSKSSSTFRKKSSSTDESYSSPVNTVKSNIKDSKRRKFIRTSSSDSEDTVNIPRKPSKSSSRSKKKSSSTDESYSSPVNTAKSNIKKRRKLIRTSSSSDSDDIVYIPRKPTKSSSRSKKKSSSTDESYSSPMNTTKSKIKVSRRRKEEKIKKLRKYFTNANVDLRREKYFWRDCQLNADKVLKWIQNQKNINSLLEDPRALQREIEVYLDNLELNTSSIISLNKRVTRSQTAAQRWQHFLKYGKTVRRWPF